jgi:CubicO group peptidase (beta-lactamase class C family)
MMPEARRSVRSALLAAAAAGALEAGLAAAVPPEERRPALVQGSLGRRLHEVLTRYHEYGFSGTVLVAQDGSVVLHEGFGYADQERRIPNGTETRFEVASLTKTFTAAAILRLEMAGRLRTEDRIETCLGPFPPAKSHATLHHLLTHTAGLVAEGTEVATPDREAFVRTMKEAPPESPPGERYRYSNAGFSLLAAVVERVSGEPYETFVRRELVERAGLRHTTVRGERPAEDPLVAWGYLGSLDRPERVPRRPLLWGTRGAGGLVMTVGDLYEWYLALRGERILSAEARAKAFHPWPTEGYGWHVAQVSGRDVIMKGGGMPDFATHVVAYPQERLVVIFASNDLRQRWRQTLLRALPAAAFGEPLPLPPPIAGVGQGSLARRSGRYRLRSGGVVEVRAHDAFLSLGENSLAVPPSVPFYAQSETSFTGFDVQKAVLLSLRFDTDPKDGVDRLELGSDAGSDAATRIR